MKKLVGLLAVMMLVLMVGCGNKEEATATKAPAAATKAPADAVAGPSLVKDEAGLLTAISKDGAWIAYTLADLTTDKELVLEGEFKNKDLPARKIALYTQDADHKVTASFKLTAPKLTIKSENARIQNGTFVGDVYVEANGFTLPGATIEGNLYFSKEEFKTSYLPVDGKVTGKTEVK